MSDESTARDVYERLRHHLIEKTVAQYAGDDVEKLAVQHVDALLDGFELTPAPKPMLAIPTVESGHGHVYPRKDRSKARCGGPRICKMCALDFYNAVRHGYDVSHITFPKGK